MKGVLSATLLSLITGLEAIRLVNHRRNWNIQDLGGVVLVGSSCAGKSVIVNAIRSSEELADLGIEVPVRFITRPKRMHDNTVENRHVTAGDFESLVHGGEIGLHWVRKMEGDREERYGFCSATPGSLPVYSGNNAFYNNVTSVRPAAQLNKLLVLGVYAPDSVRRERLITRSPDLLHERPEEVLYRLGDSSENILANSDYVIDNFEKYEESAIAEIIVFLRRIADAKRIAEWGND